MPWVVTDQGSASNNSGATLAIALATDVNVGTLIVVGTSERANGTAPGALVDSSGNSYTPIATAQQPGSHPFATLWYSVVTFALGGGSTVTYTKVTSGAQSTISVLSALGNSASPVDSAVTSTATGNSGSLSVTSGIPTLPGELFVAFSASFNTANIVGDSINGWSSPPFSLATTTNASSIGGYQTNSGIGTITFTATAVGSNVMDSVIAGFFAFDTFGGLLNRALPPDFIKKRMVGY